MRTSVPYGTKLLIWIISIFLNRYYVRSGPGEGYPLHIAVINKYPPRLMTLSFAIVLHICEKALAEYSRMNWGCDYMTDMSSVVLLSASLRKSWTMFSHQFLRWVLDAISNADRLTEEQRQATAKVDSKTSVPLKSLTIQSQSKSTILIQS